MKKFIAAASSFIAFSFLPVLQADPVQPAGLVMKSVRANSVGFASDTVFYRGDTLSLSNSVIYTGATTNTAIQDLSGVTITLVCGTTAGTDNVTTNGTIMVATSGTWAVTFTIPDQLNPYLQLSISNGALYTFPKQQIQTQVKLD